MSKKAIISLSIIAFIIVFIGVLFSTVFCLRTQSVNIIGDTPVNISKEDIITTAGLKKGESIFMIDKDKAINKIEATYPYVKVIQIKTISVSEIDIRIRARHEMFYTKQNNNFYIMDEELKVLNIVEASTEGSESNEPTQLAHIKDGSLNINSSTMICDFVGSSYQKKVMSNLYTSMVTVVTKIEGEGENVKEVYFTRTDVCDMLKEIKFEKHETFNKIIITTKYGVELDIENPMKNMQNKINICFSTIKEFLSDVQTESKAQSGTIKIYYDLDNNQNCIYVPQV